MSTTTTTIPATDTLVNKHWDDVAFIVVFNGMQFKYVVNTTLMTFKSFLEDNGSMGKHSGVFDQFMSAKGFHHGKTVELSFENGDKYLITKGIKGR